MEQGLKFNVNNLAFEIHECYHKGELTAAFTRAWRKEWSRVAIIRNRNYERWSIQDTTILGDTLIYTRHKGIIINGKVMNDKVIYRLNANKHID